MSCFYVCKYMYIYLKMFTIHKELDIWLGSRDSKLSRTVTKKWS